MDNLDIKIFSQLLVDCRRSNRQIGKELGVSGGTVMARTKKMIDHGIIEKFAIIIRPAVFGYNILYIVIKDIDTNEIFERGKFVGELDYVVPCVGGITLCSIIVKDNLEEKIKLLNELIKDVKILSVLRVEELNFEQNFTKTDIEIVDELIKDPRQKKEQIAKNTKLSTKTVARCIEKLHANNGVQFTLTCNPIKMDKFIPHAMMVWVNDQMDEAVKDFNCAFEELYLQNPLITKDQIMLYMYTDSIFKIDEITQEIKKRKNVTAVDLFIPKEILFSNKWLEDVVIDCKKASKLHLTYHRN